MRKYLFGIGESRVLINKDELNIKGEFDVLVLYNSKCCTIDNIKANNIYLFSSSFDIIKCCNIEGRIILCGDECGVIGNLVDKVYVYGYGNVISNNIARIYDNGKYTSFIDFNE